MLTANKNKFPIIVIGSNVSALSAVLRCVLNNNNVLFISETLTNSSHYDSMVSNLSKVPGFKQFAEDKKKLFKETIDFINTGHFADNLSSINDIAVTHIFKENNFFKVELANKEIYSSQYVIFCAGAKYKQPAVNGQKVDLLSFSNVITSDFADAVESYDMNDKEVIVYGQGERAESSSHVLKQRFKTVKIQLLEEDIAKVNSLESTITELVKNDGEVMSCDFLYLLSGHEIKLECLASIDLNYDTDGYITSDINGLTTIENFYVSGAIQSSSRNHLYTAIDSAVASADHINGKIRYSQRQIKLKDYRNNA